MALKSDWIRPEAIARRGIPARGEMWSPLNKTDEMAEVGPKRLGALDESDVSVRVLPVVVPVTTCSRFSARTASCTSPISPLRAERGLRQLPE